MLIVKWLIKVEILNDKDGNPVNFGEMSMDKFLQAREHIDNDNIEKILEM